MQSEGLFKSFWQGGFESSTHRLRNGQRLDVIAASSHDRRAAQDYRLLQSFGMHTVRDAVRWHLVEQQPGRYDWSSVLPQIRAARETGSEVIWDVLHYGWPDDIDLWTPQFAERFAAFAHGFAQLLARETDTIPFFAPINEISFFAWAADQSVSSPIPPAALVAARGSRTLRTTPAAFGNRDRVR